MRADEIAKRLDVRAGYELVTYREVGLPIFSVHAMALVQERQERSCIEEFVLRAMVAGLETVAQIEGILGLPRRIVATTLADLVRQEAIRTSAGGDRVSVTDRGRELLSERELVSPAEQTVWFPYDGLLRRPKWFGDTQLLRPSDLREQGIAAIRAIPARPPEVDELGAAEVSEVVRLAASAARSERQILRIQTVEKRYRMYLPALALFYRAVEGDEIQVGFAIEGRLSQEHELAFARGGGPERQAMFDGLRDKSSMPRLDGPLAGRAAELLEAASALRRDVAQITSTRSAVDKAAVAHVLAGTDEARAEAAKKEEGARSTLSAAEAGLNKALVRPLPVYEHPGILEAAVRDAKQRLVILSPWIRHAVVTDAFLRGLQKACGRGVRVSIGFGLGDVDEGEKAWDADARRALEQAAKDLPNLVVRRLGNTHAKVLIQDSDLMVITSFNWLSYRGDASRPFREEWGTLVRDARVIEEFHSEVIKRFA